MAAYGWRSARPVIDWLHAEPHRFDFYQAVRHIEALAPDAMPVGEGGDSRREAVRFRSDIKYGFPSSDVTAVAPKGEGEGEGGRGGVLMTVSFLGIAGAHGPLPTPYTEMVFEQTRRGDTGFRDFLDIFNHRLISMLFRSRRKARPTLGLEAPWNSDFSDYFFALSGMAGPALRGRMAIKDRGLLHYTGLLAQSRRSAHGLEAIIGDYFALPAKVQPFQGGWLTLDDSQTTVLGGANAVLGETAVLGRRVWDQAARIEVRLGPLTLAQFKDCLPDGAIWPPLDALIDFYTRRETEADLRLVLKAAEVPASILGRENGPLLGWTSWLTTRPAAADGQILLRRKLV